MLRIRQPHQEAQQEHRVHPPGDVEDRGHDAVRQVGQRAGDGVPSELPAIRWGGGEQDPAGVGREVGHHEPEDHEQDHQAFRRKRQTARSRHEPPERRVGERRDDRHAEEVFQDQVSGGVREQRQRERLHDALAEELDRSQRQDDESPEDGRVHQPGPKVASDQPRLTHHEHEDIPETRRHVIPPDRRFPLEQKAHEEAHPPREQDQRDSDQRVEERPPGNDAAVPMMRRGHGATPPFEETIGVIVRDLPTRVKSAPSPAEVRKGAQPPCRVC